MKSLLIVLLILTLTGCGGCTTTTKSIKYDQLTAKSVIDSCNTPEEVHNISPQTFSMPAKVIRHHNCLGVSDVLMVTWPGDASEKNLTAAKLLVLMYLEYQHEKLGKPALSAEFLKSDHLQQDDSRVQIAFYELKLVPKKE